MYVEGVVILISAILVPLSLGQAKALARTYEALHMNKPLDKEELNTLDGLANSLDEVINNWRPGICDKGFFVRLNTRSPKDAKIFAPEMFQAIEEDKLRLEKQVVESVLVLTWKGWNSGRQCCLTVLLREFCEEDDRP